MQTPSFYTLRERRSCKYPPFTLWQERRSYKHRILHKNHGHVKTPSIYTLQERRSCKHPVFTRSKNGGYVNTLLTVIGSERISTLRFDRHKDSGYTNHFRWSKRPLTLTKTGHVDTLKEVSRTVDDPAVRLSPYQQWTMEVCCPPPSSSLTVACCLSAGVRLTKWTSTTQEKRAPASTYKNAQK